eukprot:gnl/Ergobibamus_cyprinoides/1161.p1 GENE.gnl/Ergobibamus_cyprinoides/1161~~gnl/Ergobibamus_cyprinoides/1161.p1  ORF type:complete len:303 (+),score=108.14 gnl/Ergobibamus_cyprinoides/1161:239-1147(+)
MVYSPDAGRWSASSVFPNTMGTWTASVLPYPDTPALWTVASTTVAGKADPASSTVTVAASSVAAGMALPIAADLFDAHGNKLTSSTVTCRVGGAAPVTATSTTSRPGHYVCQPLAPTLAAPAAVSLVVDAGAATEVAFTLPEVEVVAGDVYTVDLSLSTTSPKASSDVTASVTLADTYGNVIGDGHDVSIRIWLVDGRALATFADGVYTATFAAPAKHGDYTVAPVVDDVEYSDSAIVMAVPSALTPVEIVWIVVVVVIVGVAVIALWHFVSSKRDISTLPLLADDAFDQRVADHSINPVYT